jgi:hypothetical protein
MRLVDQVSDVSRGVVDLVTGQQWCGRGDSRTAPSCERHPCWRIPIIL